MDLKSDSGLDIYPAGKHHKFGASIASYPEEVFYPMNSYSINEMASFVGVVKRIAGTPQVSADGSAFIIDVSTGCPKKYSLK